MKFIKNLILILSLFVISSSVSNASIPWHKELGIKNYVELRNQGEVRFLEAIANGINYMGLKAPSSIASNLVWELPLEDGNANQALITDGAGVLSWGESGGGGLAPTTDYLSGIGNGADISTIVRYKNSVVGNKPDDFGGSVSATTVWDVESNSSTPLRSDQSLRLNKKTATNIQGEGFYIPFTLKSTDLHSVLKLIGDMHTSANYADGDLRWYLVGSSDSFVADFDIIEFSPTEVLAGEYGTLLTEIQTHNSNTDYRVCVHFATTVTTIFTVDFEIALGKSEASQGAFQGDWKAYTPTLTGVTLGNGTLTAFYREYAGVADFDIRLVLGSTSSVTGTVFFGYPSGMSVDTSLTNPTTAKTPIDLVDENNSANREVGVVRSTSSGMQPITKSAAVVNATSPFTWDGATSDNMSFFMSGIPIQGRGANQVLSSDTSQIPLVEMYELSASSTNLSFADGVDEIVDYDVKYKSTHNSVTTGTAWKFTAKFKDTFTIKAHNSWATNSNMNACQMFLYLNGLKFRRLDVHQTQDGYLAGSVDVPMEYGDYIDIRLNQDDSTSAARVLYSATTPEVFNWVSITNSAGRQQIAASEMVAARHSTNSETITSTPSDIIFEDTDPDGTTHAIYNTTTGLGTTVANGWYDFDATIQTANAAWTAGQYLSLTLVINGTDKAYFTKRVQASFTQAMSTGGSTKVYLQKGDTFKWVGTASRGSSALIAGAAYNFFSVTRIGL